MLHNFFPRVWIYCISTLHNPVRSPIHLRDQVLSLPINSQPPRQVYYETTAAFVSQDIECGYVYIAVLFTREHFILAEPS